MALRRADHLKRKGYEEMSRGFRENIHAKRKRIKAALENKRKAGSKGAPTAANFRRARKLHQRT